jgi:hypothetical protein
MVTPLVLLARSRLCPSRVGRDEGLGMRSLYYLKAKRKCLIFGVTITSIYK